MASFFPEAADPSDIVDGWQRIVDLLAKVVQVPSAVVCRLEPPDYTHYTVAASSNSEGNPFPIEAEFSMDLGTFCEEVIKKREPLLVADAMSDDRWKSAPEIQVGMISYLGFPVLWPDGRMFGTICVLDNKANEYSESYSDLLLYCRDILESNLRATAQMSDELETQKAHLSELFTRVPEAVVLIGQDFRIRRINPEFTRIFGYTLEEAVGQPFQKLATPRNLQEEADALLHRMFDAEEAFATETARIRKDGTSVPVSLICVPVPSRGSERVGYLIYRDMTDMKRLEDERRRYHEIQLELAHANRTATLGQLSASIAHELNQPLTGIMTNCSACLRMLTGAPQDFEGAHKAVRRTMRDGERASEVIKRLRALFSNKEPEFELVDLNEAAREVVALAHAEFHNSGVSLNTDLAEGLPCVMADRIQLQQVILNLLRNALDAMKTVCDRSRSILIKTEQTRNGALRLSVQDTGIGFEAHSLNKIFEAFYSTKAEGMGVGLAVSRFIIESHHGRLWADLNDGPGATFSFSIPIEANVQKEPASH